MDYSLGVTFGKELLLVGFNISPAPITKAEPATIETVWKCISKPSRNWTIWTHLNYVGQPANRFNADHRPATPTSEWKPGRFYVDPLTVVIPEAFKGGPYQVSIGIYNYGSPPLHEVVASTGQRYAETGIAYSSDEQGPAMRPESRQLKASEKLSVTFGDELLLVGYNVEPSPARKGQPATLEIVWKCVSRPTHDWNISTQLTYQGRPASHVNLDHHPALSTVFWEPGKYYRDEVTFTPRGDLKPGKYAVSIRPYMYWPGTKLPARYLAEKVSEGGRRSGTMEIGFSAGR